jgi:uncharacterized protein YkwD
MRRALASRRARLLFPLLVVAALTAGCFPTGGQGAPGGINGQLFDLLNADRAAHGLPAVQWDGQLGGLAQDWSQNMGTTGQFRHRNLNEVLGRPGYTHYRRLGENILVGACNLSAQEVERAWMNSPGHRANILGNFNAVGIGTACINGRLWATQNFGLR